jgi:hypothetical protein
MYAIDGNNLAIDVPFSHSRTGLNAGTTIYYRAYATNANGTGYSSDSTFTTLP